MQETILDRLAKRAPRFKRDDEARLNIEIKKTLSKIKYKQNKSKSIKSGRGGLSSMGARGVFLKEGDIYSRRVVVKASYILAKNENARARIRHHLNYAGRNTIEDVKNSSELYAEVGREINVKDKIDGFEKAPHMFNIIISPEDGDKLDLKEFTRDFIGTIENDLRTKLDWVAGNHFDTNEPHVHLLIKGQDSSGKKLLMTRDYISRGLRVRASQVINYKLGIRSLDEVVAALKLDVAKAKKSALDDIITKNTTNGAINLDKLNADILDDLPRNLLAKRLEFLESKELANKIGNNSWQVKEGYIEELKNIERSAYIIDRISGNPMVDRRDCEILSVNNLQDRVIKGHIVERGYVDDLSDKQYVLLKSKEKSFIYVELEKYSEKSPAQVGEFIKVDVTKPFSGPKTTDATVTKIAERNEGIYDAQKHASIAINLPPGVNAKDYAQVHVNRLEVLARMGIVGKLSDDRFLVPHDYIDRISKEAEKSKQEYKPHIKITRLSPAKVAKPGLGNRLKQ